MARKVQITLEDDLDGGPADETLRFALDGVTYEIDLSEANAARMRATLGEFIAAARSTGTARSGGRSGGSGSTSAGSGGSRSGSAGSRSGSAGSGSGPTRSRATGGGPRRPATHRTDVQADPATVRAWARAQGIPVPQRGRIPADLIARFQAAQPQSSSPAPGQPAQSQSSQPAQPRSTPPPSESPSTPPPSQSPFRD